MLQIDYTTIYKVSVVGKVCGVRTEWSPIGLMLICSLRSMR